MRVLRDENVDHQYVETLHSTDWVTVATVRERLSPDASDDEIGRYATARNWVVFTGDDDFLHQDHGCGVILYHQTEQPPPGDVVDALRAIDGAYTDHSEIVEFVPGAWN